MLFNPTFEPNDSFIQFKNPPPFFVPADATSSAALTILEAPLLVNIFLPKPWISFFSPNL